MCGIAGTVGAAAAPDRALLVRMATAMQHRGPDGEGLWLSQHAGFSFRRLAVIDLDPRSNQPLHLDRLHMVFNGEIYNYLELREELRAAGHRFLTDGDSEVLLHAWQQWGEDCLNRLNGMFAIAIWDEKRMRLTLARDPFGEKPLYYAQHADGLTFASDQSAILRDRRVSSTPRLDAIETFLVTGEQPQLGESFFAQIASVPAAHVLRWRVGSIELERYWTPRPVPVPTRYDDAVEALGGLLRDSVRLRLRSDVPVGTSLSGGVDSSTIVALASRLANDSVRHAFTARFPGFARDEWPYAELTAQSAHVAEHHAVEPTADELVEDFDRVLAAHQEPIGSASIYAQWRVMKAAGEAGVVVMLDGQGGDELFAGYSGMAGYAARSEGARGLLGGLQPLALQELTYSLAVDHLPRPVARAHRVRVASPYAAQGAVAAVSRHEPQYLPWMRGHTPLRRELLRQCFISSLPPLLRYADRSSMAHSREVRLPLLDRRIAEFALSLPATFLSWRGVSKRVLRDGAADLVPPRVLARRDKIGFEPPQARWLKAPSAHRLIAETLLDPRARARGIYDMKTIESDLHARSWRDPHGIWRATTLERWLTMYEAAAPMSAISRPTSTQAPFPTRVGADNP